jgi:hypothetical protein
VVSDDHSTLCTWHPRNRKKKEDTVPKKKTDDTSNKPWLSNYPPLKEWLDKHDARCLWQAPQNPQPSDADSDWTPVAYVEGWRIRARQFILIVYANKGGWDIFTPADSQIIDASLLDAERRLGIFTE